MALVTKADVTYIHDCLWEGEAWQVTATGIMTLLSRTKKNLIPLMTPGELMFGYLDVKLRNHKGQENSYC